MSVKKDNTMTFDEFKKYRETISAQRDVGLSRKDQELLDRSQEVKGKKKKINYGGRGLRFESVIEATNEYYKDNNIALIRKIPTPVKVLKIGSKGNIESGFYEKKSALDFNGVLSGGIHIDFDTKETKNKTSFPLGNISEHQIEYLNEVSMYGGISFILVNFKVWDECYVLREIDVSEYMKYNSGRKSIEYKHFKNGLKDNLVEKRVIGGEYIYDYLKVVEKLYDIAL